MIAGNKTRKLTFVIVTYVYQLLSPTEPVKTTVQEVEKDCFSW